MKQLLCIFMIYAPMAHANYLFSTIEHKTESFEDAKKRFQVMSARQMSHVNLKEFSASQLEAFKELAQELFFSQIATASCSSPANRIKAEIMYQKRAEYDKELIN